MSKMKKQRNHSQLKDQENFPERTMKQNCPVYYQFRPVTQSCSTLCDPMDCSTQASRSFTISQSLLKLKSIESVMSANHLILYHPLFFLPSIFPSIRVFSN